MDKPTISKVRQMIAKSSGLKVSEVQATWVNRPRLVTYPTGLKGYHGVARLQATGFRTREMIVEADKYGIGVR